MDARKAATIVMNAIAQKQIAPIKAALSSSKSFYKSPANTLCAMTVASDKRRVVVDNLQGATPLQLWHAGVRAMQEKDPVLAAAVLHVLGSLPPDERPFGVAEFASRFAYEPPEKAIQAMNSVERDTEAAITAWRVVTTGRHNAAGRIQVAMGAPAFEEAGDDAVALPQILD